MDKTIPVLAVIALVSCTSIAYADNFLIWQTGDKYPFVSGGIVQKDEGLRLKLITSPNEHFDEMRKIRVMPIDASGGAQTFYHKFQLETYVDDIAKPDGEYFACVFVKIDFDGGSYDVKRKICE